MRDQNSIITSIVEFNSPQYSQDETEKMQRWLMLTTYLLFGVIATLAFTDLLEELAPLIYIPLGSIGLVYVIGNYKFFIVERNAPAE